MLASRPGRLPPLLALATVAVVLAAAVVVYLQQQAMATLQARNDVIGRQLAEQAVTDVAVELRRMLAGPVFDTLASVNHPDLRAGRLDLVAQHFTRGLARYPHVDRFFAWTVGEAGTADAPPVQFFGRDHAFVPDPALDPGIRALAIRHAAAQQIYLAADGVGRPRQQVFLRVFWTDAQRVRFLAVLGFVIGPEGMPRLLAEGHAAAIDGILRRRAGGLQLEARIMDERGALVYGTLPAGMPAARQVFPMLFYPAEDIQARLAASVSPRAWTLEVGARPTADEAALAGRLYWPLAVPGLLLLVAVALILEAHRRSSDLGRMQADFVAHVSHQLKTPLALLTAATETLQMNRVRSPERMAEYLHTIHTEARKLSALVHQVLEFSRVRQRRTLERELVELDVLVRETVQAFAKGLDQPDRFRVVVRTPVPRVEADPAALEQAVVNLLDNAAKYSGPDAPITVTVASDRTSAVIEVADRGIGIGPAELNRVFDRFYRVPAAGRREGFGLGLPIARDLVEAHGGQLEAVSTPEVGSTFRIRLRQARADRVALRPQEVVP